MGKSGKDSAFKDGKRQYFVFFRSWRDSLDMLPTESKVRLFDAIMNAGLDRKEPDNLEPIEKILWYQIRPIIFDGWDLAKARHDANGSRQDKRGGAPVGNRNAAKHHPGPDDPDAPF